MDYKDLPCLSRFQFWGGIFFMFIGLIVVFSRIIVNFFAGNFVWLSNLITQIMNQLISPTFTSGITIFGLGLAYISIAFTNID